MRSAAFLLFSILLLVTTRPAAALAKDGFVEVKNDLGTAYIAVLTRKEPTRLLSYVLITRKLPALPVPFAEVQFELLDADGQVIPTAPVPKEPDYVETPDDLGGTANGLYLVTLGPGQVPTSARLTWRGQTIEIDELKEWND